MVLDWTDAQRQKRAMAEYPAGLEAETQVQEEGMDDRGGGSDGRPTAAPDRKPPKVISPSDPSSAWTAKANKRVQFGYGLNYLIDVEPAVIVDVEPTPARTYDEVESTKTMLDRTERRFSLKPRRLAADTAYGTGRFLGWLVGRGIAPHIPVRDASESMTAPFRAVTFVGTDGAASTFVQTTKFYTPPAPCTTATCSATVPPNSTAMLVR